jgi:hypothetical protein
LDPGTLKQSFQPVLAATLGQTWRSEFGGSIQNSKAWRKGGRCAHRAKVSLGFPASMSRQAVSSGNPAAFMDRCRSNVRRSTHHPRRMRGCQSSHPLANTPGRFEHSVAKGGLLSVFKNDVCWKREQQPIDWLRVTARIDLRSAIKRIRPHRFLVSPGASIAIDQDRAARCPRAPSPSLRSREPFMDPWCPVTGGV